MTQNLVLDAKLNQDSYTYRNSQGGVVEGWTRTKVEDYQLPIGSNFAAQLYQGPEGLYKIAFRGTVNPLGAGDAAMNAGIVGGQWTAEMSESVRFTFQAIKQVAAAENISFQAAKEKLTLTGYSQGGFEAELNAKFYGLGGTSLDGPGALPLIGVAGWNAMKDWARAQEPGVQQSHDIGDFVARRYTLLVGGFSPHVGGGGMVLDNATASLFLQVGSMFTTPLGAGISLGVQGGYLHKLDTILGLEQARASYPWLQKIVDGNDASDSPLGLATIVSGKWAQVQVTGPGASVSADDVQAILQSFLADRQGQGVVVQEHAKTVYIEASNGDRLILSPDGSGLKVVGQGIATVQTEYAKGGNVVATSSIQGDDAGNTLISRRGSSFDSMYTLDATGQATHVNFKTFDAAHQLQSEYVMNRNANGTTTVQVYDGSAQLQSTSNTQTFDDGSSLSTTSYPSGVSTRLTTDANGNLFSREVTTPKGIGSETTRYNGLGALQSITTRQGDDDGNTLVSVTTGAGTTSSAYDPGNNLISENFTPAGALANYSAAGQTAVDLIRFGQLLNSQAPGLIKLASGAVLLNNLAIRASPDGVGLFNTGTGQVLGGMVSLYNLSNAWTYGDGLAKTTATLGSLNFVNQTIIGNQALGTTLNGSGLVGGAPGILPALGLISAIKANDPIGMAQSAIALFNPGLLYSAGAVTPLGWVLIGASILQSLFNDDSPPDAWGVANVSFGPGITNYLSQVNTTGENFGPDRVRGQLQSTLDALNGIIAQTNSTQPDSGQHLGIIPQRLPSLNFRASEFADKGYAVTDIDALTGAQRFHHIRFDDSGQVFNINPADVTPELRAMLSLSGAPNYPQLNAYMLNSALQRQAIAPLWEVKTAKMQEAAGDPNAGLTEEERAAKAGLGAALDAAYAQSHPNDVNASNKRIGRFMPIGIDLDRSGQISTLTNAQTAVSFDWDGLGYQKQTGWIARNDGFLVLDRNFNQSADNATELLSNPLVADPAKGLRSLAAFDANADGKIDASDPVYAQLKVWQDFNQDGNNTQRLQFGPYTEIAQDESGGIKELRSLADWGISAIDYSNSRYEYSSASSPGGVGYGQIATQTLEADQEGVRYTPVGAGIRIDATNARPEIVITQVQSAATVYSQYVLEAVRTSR